ncbi:20635_t:CDS:1, partial [Funneliformis geosporum]
NQLIKKSDLTNNQTGSPQKIPTNLEDKLKEIVNKFSQERLEGVPIDLVFGKRGDKNFSNAFANTTSYTN